MPLVAPAEVDQAVDARMRPSSPLGRGEIGKLFNRFGIIVLQLGGHEPLLTEVQGRERAGFLKVDRLLDRVFPDRSSCRGRSTFSFWSRCNCHLEECSLEST